MKTVAFVMFFLLVASSIAQTSKLYVAETHGDVRMIVDSKYVETDQSAVYPAAGTMIITEKESYQALVYSNGVGMYVGSNSGVLVRSYIQEAFPEGRDAFAFEPSVTRGQTIVTGGLVGICTGKLNAGTQLKYSTPNADINLYTSRTVIKVVSTGTFIYLLEGMATVKSSNLSKRIDFQPTLLKPNELAFLDYEGNMSISPIEKNQIEELEQYTLIACQARTIVLFQMVGEVAGAEGPEINASPVVPSKLDQSVIVSPSRLISN